MLKNAFRLALVLVAFGGCHRATDAPAPEQPGGPATKAPTSKVLLTYTGEIRDGDWIEIDGFRMLHLLDTSNAVQLPGEPVRFWSRENSPMFSPIMSPEAPWPTQPYFKSWMTGRWVGGNKRLGYPPISLVFYMGRSQKKGNPYLSLNETRPYNLSFEGVPPEEWAAIEALPGTLVSGKYFSDPQLKRFTRLRLERTDGQPIRIRTSEGYAAKIEYQ
jgi:hypothetical protein